MMKIAFFTESPYRGKYPRTFPNTRTDIAWMIALDADHYNLTHSPDQRYDLGIVIIPKKNPMYDISRLRKYCDRIAIMQEGPNWYWQDYDIPTQIWYYNTLCDADILFVHNPGDVYYYQGLTGHPNVHVLPTLMIEDTVRSLPTVERSGVIIGGNFVSWYGGFDSMIVAQVLDPMVTAPSMGRKQLYEDNLVTHLKYETWTGWMTQLNKFKYGVHLMRTHAAGTFALNCAYLGIPCIGYYGLDTQQTCHRRTTVEVGDLKEARQIAHLLKDDVDFYDECSLEAKRAYSERFSEPHFLDAFKKAII